MDIHQNNDNQSLKNGNRANWNTLGHENTLRTRKETRVQNNLEENEWSILRAIYTVLPYWVQNIFENASSSDSDVDYYIIVEELVDFTLIFALGIKITIPEISLDNQDIFFHGVWRGFKHLLDRRQHFEVSDVWWTGQVVRKSETRSCSNIFIGNQLECVEIPCA
jgi:hypothetical protein